MNPIKKYGQGKKNDWPHGPWPADMPLLDMQGIKKSFDGLKVLHGIDLTCYRGDIVAVIGPSGSGKSTLLRSANLLEEPTEGDVFFKGRRITDIRVDLNSVRTRMGIVFQSYNLFPHRTVIRNITLALQQALGVGKSEAEERARRELKRVGLLEKADTPPRFLSGGQQQRVAIARALAMQPDMMLFDEVTAALDPELVNEVLQVIRERASEDRTMMIVTHEMAFAREVATRVVFMDEGVVVEAGDPADIFTNPKTDRLKRFLSQML